MSDVVWMRHPDGTVPGQVPARAVGVWAARGWYVCDPPPEPDPALAEHIPAPAPASAGPDDIEE